ncbi:hypothetical protein [Porphyrobacter sp. AAP60]|uniref:hypothetical protein n=1 Tax=Porphyrobacter sp. AAP60 TaxID=1523423 RepID=UPI0006B8CEEC|nr:hypothetical protein [Porphyrobacter sp. AAP60]
MMREHLPLLAALLIAAPAGAADSAASGLTLPEQEFNPALVCPDGSPGACDSEDILNAVEFGANYAAAMETRCFFMTQAPCRPISAGRIFGARQGEPVIWQYMELSPSDGPLTHMLVIAEDSGAGEPYVLAARQTVGSYAPPMLVENGTEGLIIHARGRSAGGTDGRSDLILSRHAAGWTAFNIHDLLDEAQRMMPQGFTLTPSADMDFSAMILTVAVSREGDDPCCPAGGTALIVLDMPEGNLIRVSRIVLRETRPVAAHSLTPDGTADAERD